MSIALVSGKIPFIFESGIKTASNIKAASADIAAGSVVTLDSSGDYVVAGSMATGGEAGLESLYGILLNDIVYTAATKITNTSQGVTSYTTLGNDQYSGCMAFGSGSFTTTMHAGFTAGDLVTWTGAAYDTTAGGAGGGVIIGQVVNTAASGVACRITLRTLSVSLA